MTHDSLVIVITGASSGIGAATARLLGTRGHRLVLVARREPELLAVAAESGAEALPVVADVTRRDEVRRVVQAALDRFGHVDVWINNVGRGISRLPSELTDDDIDQMMQVNVKSALYGMQEVLPHFLSRDRGQVINVSSMLGRIPHAPMRSAYSAAKHFLNALTDNFRREVQPAHPGIQFTLVSPGVVYTGFGLNTLHPGPDSRTFPGGQAPDEVAAVIPTAIETRLPHYYTRPESRQAVLDFYANEP
jgi:NADP-dependent 3-hydroxy acid dehydrogenase YdfG